MKSFLIKSGFHYARFGARLVQSIGNNIDEYLSPEYSGWVRAIVLGEFNRLSITERHLLEQAGGRHLTAVSGYTFQYLGCCFTNY